MPAVRRGGCGACRTRRPRLRLPALRCQNTEERNFRALRFAGSFGWPGKLFGQFEGVAGKFVRLSAEFVSGQMIALIVGDGRGGVGVSRQVVELRGPGVRAGGAAALLVGSYSSRDDWTL